MTELSQDIKEQILQLQPFDEDNAKGFLLIYPDTVKWTPETGWLVWCGTHWKAELAEQKVDALIVCALKAMRLVFDANDINDRYKKHIGKTSPNLRNRTSTKAMLQSMIGVFTSYSIFDNYPDLLNCKNGVVDLRTGDRADHTPNQYFTYCLNVEYKPEITSKDWDRFLDQSVGGGKPVVDFLQRAVGYSLTGHTREEVLIYIHGKTRTGKGTFTNTLLKLFGKPLSAGVGFEMFQNQRNGDSQNFDLAELTATRFVVASESDRHKKLNASMLKRLTGGDDIFCAKKGKQPFTFTPQMVIWLISNFPANLDVDDEAAWYRLLTVLFPNSMKGKEDKTLKKRLQSEHNLIGILTWCVKGAMQWFEQGLQPPDLIRKQTENDRAEMDYVWRFITDHYEIVEYEKGNLNTLEKSSELYQEYKAWAEEEGYPCKGQGQFISTLKLKGFESDRVYIAPKQVRCILGLKRLKD